MLLDGKGCAIMGNSTQKVTAPTVAGRQQGAGKEQSYSTRRPRITKTGQVLAHLKRFGSITSADAFTKYRTTRLSAIIFELRRKGYDIVTEDIKVIDCNGNTCVYGKYRLIKG